MTVNTNIHMKLCELRSQFHKLPLKKTGYNTSRKYYYFEFKDYAVQLARITSELKICFQIKNCGEKVSLTLIDAENPESKTEFSWMYVSSVVSDKNGKPSGDPIQAQGASITYFQRYLWGMALLIVENDAVDSDGGFQSSDPQEESPQIITPPSYDDLKPEVLSKCSEVLNDAMTVAQYNEYKVGDIYGAEDLIVKCKEIPLEPAYRGLLWNDIKQIFADNKWVSLPKEDGGGFKKI